MVLEVFPVQATKKEGKFDLYNEIRKLVKENGISLNEGDILVISSKYISISQGRILDHNSIKHSEKADELSREFSINQKLSEAIVRESDVVFGGVSGFVITSSNNIMAPNAGIDKSNSQGKLILYPNDPYLIAEQIKRKAYEVIEFLNLKHLVNELAGNLSGGQKKLLELGRTMMVDAKLVLLDEVGAGVNRTLLKDIGTSILRLNKEKGYTFCMIEHDMDFISRLCDPVIVMAEGSVLFEGTSDEVKKNDRVIESYLGRRSITGEGNS